MNFDYDKDQGEKLRSLVPNNNVGTEKDADGRNKMPNSYYELPASNFHLRSVTYLDDKVKVSSKESAFELVSCTVLKTPDTIYNVAQNIAKFREFLTEYPDDFFFISVRNVPGNPKVAFITIAKKKNLEAFAENEKDLQEISNFESLFEKYLAGDDNFRNQRLKYIPKLDNAPWAILTSVRMMGGEKPVLQGNGYLKQLHFKGANYYEVDVDIGSSYMARQIAGSVTKYSNLFKVSECFAIEAREVAELPERALFCYTLENITIKNVWYEMHQSDVDFFKNNPFPES